MMSAFHPIATEQRTQFYVGSVPCVDGSELARAFFTFAGLVGAAMCSASHDGVSVKSECWRTVIQGGALISAGFPAKPHIRRELIPTTVPHSGRESSKRTAPLYIDGAAAPCRITATFPRIAGLLCVRSATRIAGSIRQQALRLRLQALHRR